jgi:hypothetical protein
MRGLETAEQLLFNKAAANFRRLIAHGMFLFMTGLTARSSCLGMQICQILRGNCCSKLHVSKL